MCMERVILTFLLSLMWTAYACAVDVTLEWDPNTEPDLAGYKVYYGVNGLSNPAFVDVDNHTVTTISGLDPGLNYSFAVTAYTTGRIESSYSNVVTIPPSVNSVTTAPVSSYTISDALLALRICIGIVNPTAEQLIRMDLAPVVNGYSVPDGKVDISDALAILSVVVGTLKLSP
jgi:hypothetical protein